MIPYEPNNELLAPPDETERSFLAQAKQAIRDVVTHQIPSYDIVARIGQGGFASVYLARQLAPSRLVALKVIPWNPQFHRHARFQQEAEILGKLHHPHVLTIFESGSVGGWHYYASEYCPGGSLADRIKGQVLPAFSAARITKTIAETMAAVHGLGIVHRDLKPSNVLIANGKTKSWDDLCLKIADFGLAHYSEGTDLTASGDTLGTPQYISPEQLKNTKHAGPPADIYSVGAILYELLTGRPPHLAATFAESLFQIARDDPVPPRSLVSKIPRNLETICLKCLEKLPSQRYQSMSDLAADLDRFCKNEPIHARPVSSVKKLYYSARRKPITSLSLLFAAILMGVLIVGVVWLSIERSESATQRLLANSAKFQELLGNLRARRTKLDAGWRSKNEADIEQASSLATSPHDRQELHDESIAIKNGFDFGNPRIFQSHDGEVFSLVFHPSQPLIALGYVDAKDKSQNIIDLLDTDSLRVLRRLNIPTLPGPYGGNPSKNLDGIRSLAFSPDGKWLAAGTRSGQVVKFNLESQEPGPIPLVTLPDGVTDLCYGHQGKTLIAFSKFIKNNKNLYSIDVASGKAISIETAKGMVQSIGVCRNGAYLFCSLEDKVVRIETETYQPLSEYSINSATTCQSHDGSFVVLAGGFAPGAIKEYRNDSQDGFREIKPPFLNYSLLINSPMKPWALRHIDMPQSHFITGNSYPFLSLMHSNQVVLFKPGNDSQLLMHTVTDGKKVASVQVEGNLFGIAVNDNTNQLAISQDTRVALYTPLWPGFEQLPNTLLPLADASIAANGSAVAYLTDEAVDVIQPQQKGTWTTTATYPRTKPLEKVPGNHSSHITMNNDGQLLAWHRPSLPELQWIRADRRIQNLPFNSLSTLICSPDGILWAATGGTILAIQANDQSPIIAHQAGSVPVSTSSQFQHLSVGRIFALASDNTGSLLLFNRDNHCHLKPAWNWNHVEVQSPTALQLSHDGTKALIGTRSGFLEIRSIETGDVILRERVSQDAITSISCTESSLMAVGCADGLVSLLRLDEKHIESVAKMNLSNPIRNVPIKKVQITDDGRKLFVLETGAYAPKVWKLADLLPTP